MICITHRLAELRQIAQRMTVLCATVIVMSHGHVVETATGSDMDKARIVVATVSALTHVDRAERQPKAEMRG